jgi:hypothetical protein
VSATSYQRALLAIINNPASPTAQVDAAIEHLGFDPRTKPICAACGDVEVSAEGEKCAACIVTAEEEEQLNSDGNPWPVPDGED